MHTLYEHELHDLGELYRATTSDLAIAQRDFPQHELARLLNQLVARVHPVIYQGEPAALRQLKQFYMRDFPRLFREMWPFMLASALLFYGPAVLYYIAVLIEPSLAELFLGPVVIAYAKDGTQWWKDLNAANQVGASTIMTHNLRISFLAFAAGMTFGLLTVYVLIVNGLAIGGVFAIMQTYGHAGELGEFVIGHGVLELNEIMMAGASGLMLGYAMLRPGLLSRGNAIAQAAQKAVRLLLGSAPLLVIAGLIEGFISPSDTIPFAVKAAIGIGSGVLLYAYLLWAGRSPKAVPVISAQDSDQSHSP